MATLLSLTQDILKDMISDEVTSIEDSEESRTVAKIIINVYDDLVAQLDFPEHESPFNLTETSDATPTLMTRPTNAKTLEWVRYDKQTIANDDVQYHRITFYPVQDFLETIYTWTESDDNVTAYDYTINGSTFNILMRTDKHPDIYTSFDDETLVFDSYNSEVEDFLRSSKTLCYGLLSSTLDFDDGAEPAIDDQHIPLLRRKAEEIAFDLLKDRIPVSVSRTARNLKVSSQRTQRAIEYNSPTCDLPNYGRR